ncbi:MAG TPA: hypothetical protein VH372_06255 [Actinospica sp.]|jgi:hypothetical protein|nr:hypothetical protein [Actinospica sp.]
MDLTPLVTPGAQSLVTVILNDTWAQARGALARLWARRRDADATPEEVAVERAGHELDAVRDQALALSAGNTGDRGERMQLFLAGYLAGQLAARPELAEAVAALPALLGAGTPAASITSSTSSTTVHNNFSGHARTVVQSGDIDGDWNFH